MQWNRSDLSDQIVAEADGRVRFAFMQASRAASGCDFLLNDARHGRVSIHL
jgi:hypothetical protein